MSDNVSNAVDEKNSKLHILAKYETSLEQLLQGAGQPVASSSDQLVVLAREMAEFDPQGIDYLLAVSEHFLLTGDLAKAMQCTETALELGQANMKAVACKLNLYIQNRQYELARNLVTSNPQLENLDCEATFLRLPTPISGSCQNMHGYFQRLGGPNFLLRSFDNIIKSLVNCLAIEKAQSVIDNSLARASSPQLKAHMAGRFAQIAMYLNHRDEAQRYLEESVAHDSSSADKIAKLADRLGLAPPLARPIPIAEPPAEESIESLSAVVEEADSGDESPVEGALMETIADGAPAESLDATPQEPAAVDSLPMPVSEEQGILDHKPVEDTPQEVSSPKSVLAENASPSADQAPETGEEQGQDPASEDQDGATLLATVAQNTRAETDGEAKKPPPHVSAAKPNSSSAKDQTTGPPSDTANAVSPVPPNGPALLINPPPDIEVRRAIATIENSYKDDQAKRRKLRMIADENLRGKFLIYHPDSAGANLWSRYLQDLGALDLTIVTERSDVSDCFNQGEVAGILLWFDKVRNLALQLLEDVLENREFNRPMIFVITPSKESNTLFAKYGSSLFVDNISVITRTRTGFDRGLQTAFENYLKPTSPYKALEDLRSVWRRGTPNYRTPTEARRLVELCTLANKAPGKSIWVRGEIILQKVLSANFDQAFAEADKLRRDFPNSFDAKCVFAIANASKDGPDKAAGTLLEETKKLRNNSEEKMFRVGRLFLHWQMSSDLAKLLNHWNQHEKLKKDHQFLFLAAAYHIGQKSFNLARLFMTSAIIRQPLRFEYLQTFAEILEELKDHRRAEDLWSLGMKLPRADSVACQLGMVRCCAMLRKIRIGENYLGEILKQDPKNNEALELKKKYFSGQNPQSLKKPAA